MKFTAPLRGQRASKKLDLTDMRHAFADQRMWCSVGIVAAPEPGVSHFEVTSTDVLVEVVLQPSLVQLTCRLSAALWRVPDLGEEVMVTIPEGAIEFMPTIIDVLSSGHVPTTQGPATGRIVITRTEVLVHDGNGGAVSLAKTSELNNLRAFTMQQFSGTPGHTHGVSGAATNTTVPVVTPVGAPSTDYNGTNVLKGE